MKSIVFMGIGGLSVKTLTVRDVMTEPLIVSPMDPASKVVGVMQNADVYEVFVPEQSRVCTATMRELLRMSDPEMKVASLAFHVPLLSPATTIEEAARTMSEHRIRALPVGEKNKMLGQVSEISICAEILRRASLKIRVGQIMTPHPITVESSDKIAKARNLMIRREIDHLPVMSGNKLVGIVTSSDIVYAKVPKAAPRKYSRVHEPLRRLDPHVGGLMHTHVETCSPDDDALDVLSRMIQAHATYSLVTRWEELQGIVTHRDFMKILMPPSETTFPTYIVGLPDDPFEAEATKAKFERVIQRVRRSYPDLLEARAVIKQSSRSGERKRYEVQVQFKTTKEVQTYAETGWELPAVFDVISDRLKRLTAEKRGTRRYRRRGRRARRR